MHHSPVAVCRPAGVEYHTDEEIVAGTKSTFGIAVNPAYQGAVRLPAAAGAPARAVAVAVASNATLDALREAIAGAGVEGSHVSRMSAISAAPGNADLVQT